jgi:hypothetical protein
LNVQPEDCHLKSRLRNQPTGPKRIELIVTPSGKVGFVAAEAINPLGSDQLCFGKDAGGAWKIVGMVGGE